MTTSVMLIKVMISFQAYIAMLNSIMPFRYELGRPIIIYAIHLFQTSMYGV